MRKVSAIHNRLASAMRWEVEKAAVFERDAPLTEGPSKAPTEPNHNYHEVGGSMDASDGPLFSKKELK